MWRITVKWGLIFLLYRVADPDDFHGSGSGIWICSGPELTNYLSWTPRGSFFKIPDPVFIAGWIQFQPFFSSPGLETQIRKPACLESKNCEATRNAIFFPLQYQGQHERVTEGEHTYWARELSFSFPFFPRTFYLLFFNLPYFLLIILTGR